ncbi:MAG: DUF3027 domain-containing protein [Tepidiformaceae bacterium]
MTDNAPTPDPPADWPGAWHHRGEPHIWRVQPDAPIGPRAYGVLVGLVVAEGGWYEPEGSEWLSQDELKAAGHRAWKRSDDSAPRETEEGDSFIPHQCGGCHWFAAFNYDWGMCCNETSVNDGRVVFEHGGCDRHSDLVPVQPPRAVG